MDSGSPLFLIGSHKDIVSGEADHKKISDLLKKTFKSRLSLLNVHENVEDSLCFFPIDNKNSADDSTLKGLRVAITTAIEKEKYINQKYPITWMTVCDQLKLKSEEEDYVSLEDVYAIAMDAGIECSDPSAVDPLQRNWDEVNAMLYHFHQLGVIVYYGEHQCLDQCIILNPQWIVDRITDVIREYSCVQYSAYSVEIIKTLEFQWSI